MLAARMGVGGNGNCLKGIESGFCKIFQKSSGNWLHNSVNIFNIVVLSSKGKFYQHFH